MTGAADTYQGGVANKLPSEPEERLLEVVVGLRTYVIVLQIFLPVKRNRLRLHFPLLNIHLVAAQHDRDVFANADKVACKSC